MSKTVFIIENSVIRNCSRCRAFRNVHRYTDDHIQTFMTFIKEVKTLQQHFKTHYFRKTKDKGKQKIVLRNKNRWYTYIFSLYTC